MTITRWKFVRSRPWHRWTVLGLLALGAALTLLFVREARANAATGPWWGSGSGESPVGGTAGLEVVGISSQPICPPNPAVSVGVNARTGELIFDVPLWAYPTLRGGGGGGDGDGALVAGVGEASLRFRSFVGAGSQFGCGGAGLASWENTAQYVVLNAGDPNGVNGHAVDLRRFTGRIDRFMWNGTAYVAPAGVSNALVKLGSGVYELTDKFGNRLTFDSQGMPATYTDRNGNETTYDYDTDYLVTSITNDRGQSISFGHNAQDLVSTITGPDGKQWTLTYDGSGDFQKLKSPGSDDQVQGVFITATRDGQGRVTELEDADEPGGGGGGGGGGGPQPCTYFFTYEAGTNRIATVTQDDCTWSFSYAAGVTTVTDPNGNIHRYHYTGNKITKRDMLVGGVPKYATTFGYAGERVAKVVYPRGNRVDLAWDGTGNLLSRRQKEQDTDTQGPTDIVQTWTYHASSLPASYTDPRGNTWSYTRNSVGNLLTLTHPAVTVPVGQTATEGWTYNSRGQALTYTDEEGNVTQNTYFETAPVSRLYQLQKIEVDPNGLDLETTLTYDGAGSVAAITDPNGGVHSFTWDGLRRLVERQAPAALGYRVRFEYDPAGHLVAREVENVDKDGNQSATNPWIRTAYSWSGRGFLTSIAEEIDASTTRTTTFEYDCNGNRTRVTKPEGNKEAWTYDERDQVASHVRGEGDALASTALYFYDDNGNLVTRRDARGNDTTYLYDLFDRRTRETNALGHYWEWELDKNGNITVTRRRDSSDAELQRESQSYDERNRRWKLSALFREGTTTHPDAVTTWERLKTGQIETETSPANDETHFEYDAASRLTKVTDAAGNEWTYTLDKNGNLTGASLKEIDGMTSVVHDYEASYDALNRRTEWVEIDRTNATNRLVTSYFYDSRSNLVFKVNAEGSPTRWTYDDLDRLVKRERALAFGTPIDNFTSAQVTEWGFDKNNRLVLHKDDGGNSSTYEYDALDRRTKLVYPDLKSVVYEHDGNDNVTKVTDPAGNVVTDTYDVLNRNTARAVALATGFLGTTAETRTYDALNRTVTNEDNDYKLAHEYAELGLRSLIRGETQSYVGGTAYPLTFAKSYDSRGNVVGETYPAGASLALTLSYNAISQLTAVSDGTNTVASYTHVGLRRKTVAFQNGAVQTNSYTGFRTEVATIHHDTSGQQPIVHLEYGYNKVHDRLYERFGGGGSSGDAFEYDKIRRLTKAWMGSSTPAAPAGNPYVQTIDYNYADDGNRSSVVVTPWQQSAQTTGYTTNSLYQYTAVGGTSRTHDANGNLTDDGTLKYKYDYRSQIVEIRLKSDNSLVAEYRYDALGRRVEKSTSEGVERYFLCTRDAADDMGNLANVMATYDGSGNWKQSFVHHGDVDDIAMLEQADVLDFDSDGNTTERTRSFYHLNALGSVTEITDLNEATVASYRYDPYGRVTITRGGTPQATDPLGQHWGFTGRFLDEESGLLYYRARYYDPETGRFLQRDPLGYASTPNLFEYVRNNPVNFLDPSGLRDVNPITYKNSGDKDQKKQNIKDAIKAHNDRQDKKTAAGDKDAKNNKLTDKEAEDIANAIVNGKEDGAAYQRFKAWPVKDECGKWSWKFIHVRYFTIVPEDASEEVKKHEEDHHDVFDAVKEQYEKDKESDPPTEETRGKEGRAKEKEDTKAWTGNAHKDLDAETNHGRKPRTSSPSAIAQRSKPK